MSAGHDELLGGPSGRFGWQKRRPVDHKNRQLSRSRAKDMADSQQLYTTAKLWSLQQAALWVQTRGDAAQHSIGRTVAPTTLQELHEALKVGTINGSGCADGGERRAISPAEWHDYRLTLEYAMFPGHYYIGSLGVPVIAVLSIRSFPAGALKYHGHKSGVQIPSARSPNGETGFHRVIDDVLLLREEVVQQWPAIGQAPSSQGRLPKQARSRPALEGAQRMVDDLYPDGLPDQVALPNGKLYHRVRAKLKEAHLPDVSDDTILRAAGRRRR